MSNDLELNQTLTSLLSELTDQIEKSLLSNLETNEELTSKFMRILEDSSSADSSASTSETSSDEEEEEKPKKLVKKRVTDDEDEESSDEETGDNLKNKKNFVKYPKTKDEVTIDDLGPVEKFEINLEDEIKLAKLGKVISKVDNKLIVIQSLRAETEVNPPPLDEDTIIFDSNRKSLGKIFETFGPVSNPFYTIRFNSLNEITERNLDLDLNSLVYYAESTKYTKFVFNLDELRKQKGSDASWNNDNEPPVECLDYSDDEQEKQAKKELKQAKAKIAGAYSDSDSDETETETNSKKSPQKKNFNKNSNGFKRKYPNNNQNNQNNFGYVPQMQTNYYPMNNWVPQMPPHGFMYPPNQVPPQFNPFYPPFMQFPPQQQFNYPHQAQYNYPPSTSNGNNPQVMDRRFIKNNNNNYVKKSF